MKAEKGIVHTIQPDFQSTRFFSGHRYRCHLYIPTNYDPSVPTALYVQQDGMLSFIPSLFERLSAEGVMPVCIGVGVDSGSFAPTRPGGTVRSTRSQDYDGLGRRYADFLIEELLPYLKNEYDLRIADSPDLHLICGCSSGGICAWNAAWERNDFFRRVYMSSPTFSSFRGGDSLVVLMRKYETKPIRAYMIAGTDDMRNSAGDWYLEALAADAALKYAGYDYGFEVFPNGPHGVGFGEEAVFERAMRFLWRDWQTQPVKALGLPPRVADILFPDQPWMPTSEAMPFPMSPTIDAGCYHSENCQIWLTRPDGTRALVAETGYPIAGLALSCDGWRLYIAGRERRFIDVMAIQPDGTLTDRYEHAHLHIADDCPYPGATAIAVDTQDRLYAATALGIQTFSFRGHNNTVLALPGHLPAEKLAFGGADHTMLYAQSGQQVFRRPVRTTGMTVGHFSVPGTEPF